ncbi:MAG: hypothetical protein OXG44_01440 [Gammaproteobacteria bacterium]|nr:hypothetical protein [Gammaproteobacteria bacterium]
MTIYLALDYISPAFDFPNGEIRAINRTQQGIADLGYTTADGYTGNRLRAIDETSADWDNDCVPGWLYIHTGQTPKVVAALPRTAAQQRADQVAADIALLQDAVNREADDWERVVARENFSPHTDSGHSWSDDLLHSLIKPNIRGLVVLLAAAKASPTQNNITAYRARLDSFVAIASDPGVLNIYNDADKSVWRPLRTGDYAYGYDTASGGVRTVNNNQVRFAVTYPTGESVATWDALAAVDAL